MRILPLGETAVLVELDSLSRVLALFRLTEACSPDGIVERIPAARTLLIRFDPLRLSRGRLRHWLGCLHTRLEREGDPAAPARTVAARCIEIPVRYVGADLEFVAERLGLSPREVVQRHGETPFEAAFAGFSPGFVYLTGGDPCFQAIPRRAQPRTRVAAGSVATAGGFSAVYPSDSPGGWQLLGVTSVRIWDVQRDPPAWIRPGDQVRFRDAAQAGRHYSLPSPGDGAPVSDTAVPAPETPRRHHSSRRPARSGVWFRVLSPGMQTLFQDGGRPGQASLGVSRSGALDRSAMRAANALVGNPPSHAVLENLLGDLELVCEGGPARVAVTGALASVMVFSPTGMRVPAAAGHCLLVEPGQRLRIGRVRAGVRCYVAVAGGWQGEPVLGSCASDMLSGLGPAALSKGDDLSAGWVSGNRLAAGACAPASASGEVPGPPLPRSGDMVFVRVSCGPRLDWFGRAALDTLLDNPWRVTADSNRVGLRLAGPRLRRSCHRELPSEGMVAGAVQVPPNGQPLIFLADHPLTGGYPVMVVINEKDLDRLAQVPVGAWLRFVPS